VKGKLRIENEELRIDSHEPTVLNSQFSILNLMQSLLDKHLVQQIPGVGEPRCERRERSEVLALPPKITHGHSVG